MGCFEVLATPYNGFEFDVLVAHLKYGHEFWTFSKNLNRRLKTLTSYEGLILGITSSEIVSLNIIGGLEIHVHSFKESPQSTKRFFGMRDQ